jgi:hypothetical protein
VRPPEFQAATNALKADQAKLYEELYAVLSRDRSITLQNLADIYGLGSTDPSPFALELVVRLKLRESCALILQSEREIEGFPKVAFLAPRTELGRAVESLNCR